MRDCQVDVLGRLPASVCPADVRRVLAASARALGLGKSGLVVRFGDDRTLRRFNRRFRGVDRATDVLSFPADAAMGGRRFLGDLLVSRERARVQARRAGLTPRREVEELVLHGLLHLLGYDHAQDRGEMDALELQLRSRVLDRRRRVA